MMKRGMYIIMTIDMGTYGWDMSLPVCGAAGMAARVTAVHRERYALVCPHGEIHGRLKRAAYFERGRQAHPTVGDFVRIAYSESGDSLILQTLPRRSAFSRRDGGGHVDGYVKHYAEHIVAANFDCVFIMQSFNNDFNQSRMLRYLALACQSGAVPVVVLTKADLVQDTAPFLSAAQETAVDTEVIAVSAVTGEGMNRVRAHLAPGRTAVFLGSSGVGKSSLVNALMGHEAMKVNAIREDDARGRHTTTHRQLILLPGGGMVIDTPGMRELGMWDAETGLEAAFADVEAILARGCRFSNCSHQSEPGCALKAALQSGELPEARWAAYQGLRREARHTADKSVLLRDKNAREMQISMHLRAHKKSNGKGMA